MATKPIDFNESIDVICVTRFLLEILTTLIKANLEWFSLFYVLLLLLLSLATKQKMKTTKKCTQATLCAFFVSLLLLVWNDWFAETANKLHFDFNRLRNCFFVLKWSNSNSSQNERRMEQKCIYVYNKSQQTRIQQP